MSGLGGLLEGILAEQGLGALALIPAGNAGMGLPTSAQWPGLERVAELIRVLVRRVLEITGLTGLGTTETSALPIDHKSVGTDGTDFLYDDLGRLWAEVDSTTGTPKKVYSHDAIGLIGEATYLPSGKLNPAYFLYDGLGSNLVATDQRGNATKALSYDAFGVPTTQWQDEAFGYTGRWGGYTDERVGVLNWNRWYLPSAGRWGSRDPIGIKGGENLYAYVLNQPVNFFDENGEDITVCYYPDAAKGLGHMGVSVHSSGNVNCNQIGFYPAAGLSPISHGKPTVDPHDERRVCTTFRTTAEQDAGMRAYLASRLGNPGYYVGVGNSCVNFAVGTGATGGLRRLGSPLPYLEYNFLRWANSDRIVPGGDKCNQN